MIGTQKFVTTVVHRFVRCIARTPAVVLDEQSSFVDLWCCCRALASPQAIATHSQDLNSEPGAASAIHAKDIRQGPQGAGEDDTEMEYVADLLSFNDFRFDHRVPTVKMHKVHMKYVPVQNSVPWLKERQQGQPYHNLSEPFGRFMGNRHVGTSLDGLHSRDDELLMVPSVHDQRCSFIGFFKTYKQMSSSEQATLPKFYTATRNTNFVEKAKICPSQAEVLKLQVTPVGETRLPTNALELKVALKCIFLALQGCHALQWAINDIRWPNISVDLVMNWLHKLLTVEERPFVTRLTMEQATAKAACRARNLTYVTAQPYYTPYMVPLTALAASCQHPGRVGQSATQE
ncbi:hypothetical protein WJX82_009844 [Trebouxia sp. C0006]